ncbi:MAG: GGDEF domain-containing protein [Terracidiphilus sp.]|jgi:diguanylate cyclase (GGDEF)-like protein
MKGSTKALAIILGWTSVAWAAQPAALTTLHAIHALSRPDAQKGLPVAFEATVTYYNSSDVDLFVQEGTEAIYVQTKPNQDLAPGDRVLVRGKTRDSFRPDVLSDSVTRLHPGALPMPVPAGFGQLIRAELDCMRVTVRATVRSADAVNFENIPGVYLKLLMDGGSIDATVLGSDAGMLKELLDADVEVTGVVSGEFDSKSQLTGILLEVSTFADVKILKRAQTSPDSLPVTPMDQVLSAYRVNDLSRRVRVQGTITYYEPGSAVVLEDGAKSLWISTHASDPMRIGDVAEATGFPDARYSFLALTDGKVQDSHIFKPIPPQPSTWGHLATWNSGSPEGHQNDLVSIEGQVAAAVREDSQDEFVLASNGKLFTAIYRHPLTNGTLPPMKQVPLGAKIRVTGICMVVQANTINPAQQEVPFNILLRSFDDVALVAEPSWLSVRNLILLVGLLLAVVIVVGARGWFIERTVRRQTATLAYIERRRSRILEDINGSRPLAEIIEEITELVSFKLKGAPCWCQIVDGALLGNCPQKLSALRIVQHEIPARSGAARGTLFAAFDPLTKPSPIELEALTMPAALATLAIETRRLYSDLLRRSEFDLLTDIHNRFSLDKRLDDQIDDARQNAGIFGLVYIDLDGFKQINDLYGHQVGDLYLQQAAVRMKRQLRSVDTLARLGGDEFAALVPVVRSRADVEEIALRLERCFDGPFEVEGNILHGSASVGIALYPQDGNTKDSLLNAADAAMYVAKHNKRQIATALAGHQNPKLTPKDPA